MKAKFINAVDENDIVRVRLFLSNEMLLDPRGASFQEMKTFAESRIADLYEPADGKEYDVPEEQWNESFLFSVKNDLDSNFSQERLVLYVKVAQTVLKEKALNLDKEEEEEAKVRRNAHAAYEERNQESEQCNQSGRKKMYSGLVVGGVIVTVVGLCVSKFAIASIGAVGAVAGGYLLHNEKTK